MFKLPSKQQIETATAGVAFIMRLALLMVLLSAVAFPAFLARSASTFLATTENAMREAGFTIGGVKAFGLTLSNAREATEQLAQVAENAALEIQRLEGEVTRLTRLIDCGLVNSIECGPDEREQIAARIQESRPGIRPESDRDDMPGERSDDDATPTAAPVKLAISPVQEAIQGSITNAKDVFVLAEQSIAAPEPIGLPAVTLQDGPYVLIASSDRSRTDAVPEVKKLQINGFSPVIVQRGSWFATSMIYESRLEADLNAQPVGEILGTSPFVRSLSVWCNSFEKLSDIEAVCAF